MKYHSVMMKRTWSIKCAIKRRFCRQSHFAYYSFWNFPLFMLVLYFLDNVLCCQYFKLYYSAESDHDWNEIELQM